MQRRNFLKTCGGMFLLSQMPVSLVAGDKKKKSAFVGERRQITIPVGATEPFMAVHMADTHVTFADGRDDERKNELARSRRRAFPNAAKALESTVDYAVANDMLILHTGDLIDFVSAANIDYVASKLNRGRWIVSAGNHEYSQYVGEAKEDESYKAVNYDRLQAVYPNNLKFASKIINGVNFVAIDDVYYNFTADHLSLMKEEVKKGLPIVMLCHVPLYTPDYYTVAMYENGNNCAYLTGTPQELTETYQCDPLLSECEQWRNRSVQQRSDAPTLEFISWLKGQPLLKAIFCGHNHRFHQTQFSSTAAQYVVGAGYNGDFYEITFI